jgi:ParB family chromosome partitioning protein
MKGVAKMPTKMNEACTLKTLQIVKNPALTLGMSQKDVSKYKKVAAAYGNVAPVIVSAPVDGGYLILAGSARLEACAQTGINEVPAVMACGDDEAGQLKLALMMTAIRDEISALSEGALISRLINEYGVAPRELVNLLGKSKAWVSKRLSMDQNLTETVKKMVTDGTLCPRSAEEVARLPGDVQARFAANAVNGGLNKTEIGLLVVAYKNSYSGDVRRKIIESPLEALSKLSERIKKKTPVGAGLNSPGRKLCNAANYAAQMLLKAVNMAENADECELFCVMDQFSRLRDISGETAMTLNRLLSDVSLGKPGGGQA